MLRPPLPGRCSIVSTPFPVRDARCAGVSGRGIAATGLWAAAELSVVRHDDTRPRAHLTERNLRVLIADENEDALRGLHAVLAELGHEVTPYAVSVREAVELIATRGSRRSRSSSCTTTTSTRWR